MKKGLIVIVVLILSGVAAFATGTEEPMEAGMEKITYSCYYYYQLPDAQKAFEDYFLETTGVEMEVVSVPKDDWEDKIRAMMVSGDVADVTQAPNDMTPLVNQGFLVGLSGYINAHSGFRALKAEYPQIFRSATVNDEIYGIASGGGSYMNLWIRQDWLDELGLAMPNNMNDLVSALDAFKDTEFSIGTGRFPL
jgi:ABC-type glycerol-3-phosphate transport system substrate-binding protein